MSVKTPVIIIDPRAQTPGLRQHKGTGVIAKNIAVKSGQKVKPVVAKKNRPALAVQQVKKTSVKSVTTETKKLSQKKIEQKKRPVKKEIPTKKVVKPAIVKKKNTVVKKQQEKTGKIKKTAPLPIPVVEEPKKTEPQPVGVPVEQNSVEPVPQNDIATIDGPIVIARSAQEAAALTIQLQLQEELLRVWHPPVGIDDAVSCQVRVLLDATGIVQQIEMIKPSGMLLFDVSARAAVQQAVWPRGVWGTTLELVLQ